MSTLRKSDATTRDNRASTTASTLMSIEAPPRHQGVGNALRATFRPARDDMPEDMMALLKQLDRH
ncbi:hypothetical protein GGR44_003204 [Sphingobium fontiphilum]|uniref:Anti-sigma factor NepR domain-containing protein n=1 Tax=Sphingobium fontiphilum TaxID=944425 RepID=A0A7W6DI79_9SPHN|nr:hypothetical protein [Sphingobium fontiphilum]MBB3983513.1 hypothetical protein [Sphingobium fontiphilum]